MEADHLGRSGEGPRPKSCTRKPHHSPGRSGGAARGKGPQHRNVDVLHSVPRTSDTKEVENLGRNQHAWSGRKRWGCQPEPPFRDGEVSSSEWDVRDSAPTLDGTGGGAACRLAPKFDKLDAEPKPRITFVVDGADNLSWASQAREDELGPMESTGSLLPVLNFSANIDNAVVSSVTTLNLEMLFNGTLHHRRAYHPRNTQRHSDLNQHRSHDQSSARCCFEKFL